MVTRKPGTCQSVFCHRGRGRSAGVAAGLVALAIVLGAAACGGLPPLPAPTSTPSPTPSAAPALVAAVTATPSPCAAPAGWEPYTVRSGDTLWGLAQAAGATVEEVQRANCLTGTDLAVGRVLYLPPQPTPTPCAGVPAGWLSYRVGTGDTLSGLAQRAGTSVEAVAAANCLPASATLTAGQALFLPPLPTPAPTPCAPAAPVGWQPYRVQPGDTLFDLALVGATTVDRIMAANCITTSAIFAGQALLLPAAAASNLQPVPAASPVALAPPPAEAPGAAAAPAAPAAPGQPATPPEAFCGGFTCATDGFAVASIPVGEPNEAYVPCRNTQRQMVISVYHAYTDTENYRHAVPKTVGQHIYLYACNFPPGEVTATLTGPVSPGGSAPPARSLALQVAPLFATATPRPGGEALPILDPALEAALNPRKAGRAQGVAVWDATCDTPPGEYRVALSGPSGAHAERTIDLRPLDKAAILVVPQVARVGGPPLQAWFCYPQARRATVERRLYRSPSLEPALTRTPQQAVLELQPYSHWTRPVAGQWSVETLPIPSSVPTGTYQLEEVGGARTYIWLLP